MYNVVLSYVMLVKGDEALGENTRGEERIRFINTGPYRIVAIFDGLLRSCSIWRDGLMEIFDAIWDQIKLVAGSVYIWY